MGTRDVGVLDFSGRPRENCDPRRTTFSTVHVEIAGKDVPRLFFAIDTITILHMYVGSRGQRCALPRRLSVHTLLLQAGQVSTIQCHADAYLWVSCR